MNEQTFVLVKPTFVRSDLIDDLEKTIEQELGLKIVGKGMTKYNVDDAKRHYDNKKDCPYFDELVSYLTSDKVYGLVIYGENAINKIRDKVMTLRKTYQKKFNLKTDVMRNILHASSNRTDATKEIEIFTHKFIYNCLKK